MKVLLAPAAFLYRTATDVRNWCFDHKLVPSRNVGTKVVAIGNLTAGGTGKTPLIAHLIDHLQKRGASVGVVSRGYKGQFKGVAKVPVGASGSYWGDEPAMLAARFPMALVFVGADRCAASEALLKEKRVNVILADDAFQHRWLHRDLNVVIVDATQPLEDYKMIPQGLLREAPRGLQRAHFIVLNKTNLASAEQVASVRKWLAQELGETSVPILEAHYRIVAVEGLVDRTPMQRQGGSVFLVSAIGRPKGFSTLVTGQTKVKIVGEKSFADHYELTNSDLDMIQGSLDSTTEVWVTEKDAVKLRALQHPLLRRTYSVKIELSPYEGFEALYAALDRIIR